MLSKKEGFIRTSLALIQRERLLPMGTCITNCSLSFCCLLLLLWSFPLRTTQESRKQSRLIGQLWTIAILVHYYFMRLFANIYLYGFKAVHESKRECHVSCRGGRTTDNEMGVLLVLISELAFWAAF